MYQKIWCFIHSHLFLWMHVAFFIFPDALSDLRKANAEVEARVAARADLFSAYSIPPGHHKVR